jgi:hypothetical protein
LISKGFQNLKNLQAEMDLQIIDAVAIVAAMVAVLVVAVTAAIQAIIAAAVVTAATIQAIITAAAATTTAAAALAKATGLVMNQAIADAETVTIATPATKEVVVATSGERVATVIDAIIQAPAGIDKAF